MPFSVIDAATATAVAFTGAAPITGGPGRTLLGFRTKLRLRLGNRTDADAYLDGWVNAGYQKIFDDFEVDEAYFSLSLTSVIDQPFYLLPASILTTSQLSVIDVDVPVGGWPLDKIDLETYRKLPSERGDPCAYFRFQNVLVLWPTPAVARVHSSEGKLNPTILSSDTHQTLLGARWDEVLSDFAAYFAFKDLNEPGLAAVAQNDAVAGGRSIISRRGEEQDNLVAGFRPARSREEAYAQPRRALWPIPRI